MKNLTLFCGIGLVVFCAVFAWMIGDSVSMAITQNMQTIKILAAVIASLVGSIALGIAVMLGQVSYAAAMEKIDTSRARSAVARSAATKADRMTDAMAWQLENALIFLKNMGGHEFEALPKPKTLKAADMPVLPDPAANVAKLPEKIALSQLMSSFDGSISSIILGVGAGSQIVKGDMTSAFHLLIAGTSRWGKSVFQKSLLTQLMMVREPVRFILADASNNTFNDFDLPVATSREEIAAALANAVQVCHDRTAAYAATGQSINSLERYNDITGNALPYLFVFLDEGTGMFNKRNELSYVKAAHESALYIAQKAAKYGVYLCFSGQNMKAENMPTDLRDQFSSRFQFKATDRHQARMLFSDCRADQIRIRGRVLTDVEDKYGELREIQTPFVDDQDTVIAFANQTYRQPIDVISGYESYTTDQGPTHHSGGPKATTAAYERPAPNANAVAVYQRPAIDPVIVAAYEVAMKNGKPPYVTAVLKVLIASQAKQADGTKWSDGKRYRVNLRALLNYYDLPLSN